MKYIKRVLCIIMCVVVLSLSVGTKYFDANHMEKVEAVAEGVAVGLSAAAMYALCFYVGTVAYANAPIEMNSFSDDQIASMGYSTLSYIYNDAALNAAMSGPTFAPNPAIIGFIDKAGQSYVFGSNAVKAVAETSFQVIQGGKKPDDDDDNDDDKEEEGGIIDGLIKFPGNVRDMSACCTLTFGTILGTVIKEQYDKYQNGEGSIYLDVGEQYSFTGYDAIKNSSGNYVYHGVSSYRQLSVPNASISHVIYSLESSYPLVCCGGSIWRVSNGDIGKLDSIHYEIYENGILKYSGNRTAVWYWFNDPYASSFSLSLNMPMYNTYQEGKSAVASGDYSGALNYAEPYRIADWLQDDWAGKLLDPLTGLNALSNWANIARHQGLNALGNELDVDAFDDHLRDYFANLGTDHLPEVDPAKAPILWPAGDVDGALDPETSIDPARNPAIWPDPALKPDPGTDPDPGTKPDPGTDPGTDPDPGVTPLPDITMEHYQVDLKDIFPFCIPFDFIELLRVLDAQPRAPCFTFPVVIPALDYREDVELDLSVFDDVARVIRLCEKVSFILFLMFVTSKVIRW